MARYKAFVVFDIVYIIYSLQPITWLIHITWSFSNIFRVDKKPWKVGKSTDISSIWICQCRIGYVSYETRLPCDFMRCPFRPIRMQKHLRTQVRKKWSKFQKVTKGHQKVMWNYDYAINSDLTRKSCKSFRISKKIRKKNFGNFEIRKFWFGDFCWATRSGFFNDKRSEIV